MDKYTTLIGRILMAHIFLLSGFNKMGSGYAATQGYMDSMGVPGILLPAVILVEIAGSLALIVGWQTRWAAWALAAFTFLSAVFFHANFGDQMQMIMFMKNIAMVGGLMFIAACGAGAISVDERLSRLSQRGIK